MKSLRYYILISLIFIFAGNAAKIASAQEYADDKKPVDATLLQNSNENPMISRGTTIEIPRSGFRELSQIILEELNKYIAKAEIPDMDFTVAPLLRIKIQKMQILPEISDLKIIPFEDGLKISIQLKKLDLKIATMEFANYFAPTFATKCHNTALFLGHTQPFPIEAGVKITLVEENIGLNLSQFSFNPNKDQYGLSGPDACYSSFGNKAPLTRNLVVAALSQLRAGLSQILEKQFKSYLPELASKLNRLTRGTKVWDMPDFLIFPATHFALSFKPRSLVVSDEGLSFELSTQLSGGDPNADKQYNKPNPKTTQTSLFPTAVLGLNPEVINQFFMILFRHGSREFELSPALHSLFAELLSIQTLEEFWPELKVAMAEVANLRLYITIQGPPELAFTPDNQALYVRLPRPSQENNSLRLRFQIRKNGRWQDFYFLNLSLRMTAKPDFQDSLLNLPFSAAQIEILNGAWASTYQAQDATFDSTRATITLQQAVNHAFTTYTQAASYALPPLSIKNRALHINQLAVENPYIKVGLRLVL